MTSVTSQRLIVILVGVGFGLLVAWGIWAIGAGDRRNRALAEASLEWAPVTVTVGASEVELDSTRRLSRPGRTNRYIPKVNYSFYLDGKVYRGDAIQFGGPVFSNRSEAEALLATFPPGQERTAYYNPTNPAQSVLEPGIAEVRMGRLTTVAFMVLGIVIAVGSLLIGLFGDDRHFQPKVKAATVNGDPV